MADEQETPKLPDDMHIGGKTQAMTYQVEIEGHPEVAKHLRTILVTVEPMRAYVAAVHFGKDEGDILRRCSAVAADDRPDGMPCIMLDGYSMVPVDVVARLLRTEDAIAVGTVAHDAIVTVLERLDREEERHGAAAPVVVTTPKTKETVH